MEASIEAEMVESGMDACGGLWPACNNKNDFEGANKLSEAPIASLEGEHGVGGTVSEWSGRMPDLDLFWIGSPAME